MPEQQEDMLPTESPKEVLENTLTPQVMQALRNEANGEDDVEFIIQDVPSPNDPVDPAIAHLTSGMAPARGKLRVTGLYRDNVTFVLEDSRQNFDPIFRFSIDVVSRNVTIPPSEHALLGAKEIEGLLRSQDGEHLDRPPVGRQLGPARNTAAVIQGTTLTMTR